METQVHKKFSTQWIGQFGVASELTRRNYLISFGLGNMPGIDLLCQSPKGKKFSVQVKCLRSKGYFPFQDKLIEKDIPGLFVIFVYAPEKLNSPLEYFVFRQKDFRRIWQKESRGWKTKERLRGKPYKDWSNGIGYQTLLATGVKNKWSVLPG